MPAIRATVLGIVRRDDELLVQRLVDPEAGAFHRPIGGGIEFGETSGEALEREFREELDVRVEAGPVVGTVENRFTFGGTRGHEFVTIRRGEFRDEALYERDRFSGVDDGGSVEYEAYWRTLPDLVGADEPLYPEGLAPLLDDDAGDGRGHVTDR